PYISYIILGIILAIVLHPIYRKMLNLFRYKTLTAIIIDLLIILLIFIPFYYLAFLIIKESSNIYLGIDALSMLSDTLSSALGAKIALDNIAIYLLEFLRNVLGVNSSSLISSITDMIIGLLLILLIVFYALTQGEDVYKWLKRYFPLKKNHRNLLFTEIDRSVKGFVYGQFLAAIAQGLMVSLGFYMFGLSNALFWGFVAFILSLIPFVGAPFVWVPGAIILIVNGSVLNAILLIMWGVIVVSNIDNVMRIYVMKKTGRIHELIVLLGFLGGIKLFGFIGILLGPLILALLLLLIRFYVEEYGPLLE
ncbi:AI-2E family transporter, partial [Candidatus Woesearchaeota archaeon]|nr:AI-2E family transporter [Candidatus Woesearchaeota archaeon]